MTGPDPTGVRPAVPTDAAELARLRYRFRTAIAPAAESEEGFVARCRDWMTERLRERRVWRCWVAEAKGRVVGTIWLGLIEKMPNPVAEPERHGYLTNLFVDPAARGQGTGSALLEAALRECEALKCDAVILWPTPRSRPLYLRHGFEVGEHLLVRQQRGGGLALPEVSG